MNEKAKCFWCKAEIGDEQEQLETFSIFTAKMERVCETCAERHYAANAMICLVKGAKCKPERHRPTRGRHGQNL
jgi:hypothetical protein